MNDHNSFNHTMDAFAFIATFSSVVGWLPPMLAMISSGLSIVWLSIQIGGWVKKRFF